MKLDEYVRQTLIDISKGVSDAKDQASVGIAPGYVDGKAVFSEQLVSFEILVTVTKEGGGGIKVFSVADIEARKNSEQINKLSFQVPVYFQAPPVQKTAQGKRRK